MRTSRVLTRLLPAAIGCLLMAACGPSATPSKPAASGAAPASQPTASAPSAASAPAASTAPTAADAKLPAPVTVHFGYTPLLAGGPVFVGLERGYFEELNVNL